MKTGWHIAFSSMWFATALAVGVGLYYTHSIHCLWFMLIPSFVSFSSTSGSKEKKENQDEQE